MKHLRILALLLISGAGALGQGFVNFANIGSGSGGFVNAPVTNGFTGQRVSGNSFQARLYIAPAGTTHRGSLTTNGVEGTSVFFATGAQAGYFLGGKRIITGYGAGQTITAAVRVWSSAFGNWESAPASEKAESNLIQVKLASTAAGTSNLVGLQPMTIRLVAPPYPFAVAVSNASVLAGSIATLSPVTLSGWGCATPFCGSPPFDYTWSFNGTNVSVAPTLTISNAQPANAGTYQLRIENTAGWIQLSATLSVTNLPIALTSPTLTNGGFQFTLTGQAGSNYVIQSSTDLTASNWVSRITNTAPFTFVETNLSLGPQQFYRAVTP